jgi:MFS family permease
MEVLLAIAVTSIIAALKLEGAVPALAIAVIAGFVTFIVLGASWPYMLWQRLGETLNLAIDPPLRTWLMAVVVVAALGALAGLILGARAMGAGGGIAGLIGGAILGGIVGAFLAYDFGWRVGAALGLAVALGVYMGVLIARVTAKGVDFEIIKLRFWPQQTIDTTRETIEWAKARNPRGPKS